MLKCALSRWIVHVCCWNSPELEREMFSLVSAGLTFCQLRGMKGKERSHVFSAAFYGAQRGVPG